MSKVFDNCFTKSHGKLRTWRYTAQKFSANSQHGEKSSEEVAGEEENLENIENSITADDFTEWLEKDCGDCGRVLKKFGMWNGQDYFLRETNVAIWFPHCASKKKGRNATEKLRKILHKFSRPFTIILFCCTSILFVFRCDGDFGRTLVDSDALTFA